MNKLLIRYIKIACCVLTAFFVTVTAACLLVSYDNKKAAGRDKRLYTIIVGDIVYKNVIHFDSSYSNRCYFMLPTGENMTVHGPYIAKRQLKKDE